MVKLIKILSSSSSTNDKVNVQFQTSSSRVFYELEHEVCVSLPNDSMIMGMLKDIEFPSIAYLRKVLEAIYSQKVVLVEDFCWHNNKKKIAFLLKTNNAIEKRILNTVKYSKSKSFDIITLSTKNIFEKDLRDITIKFNPCGINDNHRFFKNRCMDGSFSIKKEFDSEDLAIEYVLNNLGLTKVSVDPDGKTIFAEPAEFIKPKSIHIHYDFDSLKTYSASIEMNGSESRLFLTGIPKKQSVDELCEILNVIKVKDEEAFASAIRNSIDLGSIEPEDV